MPSCPLRSLTGVPCPFCGMTRGSLALLHGNVGTALRFNPGVLLLAVGVLAGLFFAVARRPRPVMSSWWLPATIGALWAYQLFKLATGRLL